VIIENEKQVDCKEFLSRYYKFYLAFENSICDDYITEKFFGILRYNIVPIVYGGGKYDAYIPKSGYINALDYKTPKDLADYMLYLDRDPKAYNAYFKWKRYIVPNPNGPLGVVLCEMCLMLNLEQHFGIKKSYLNNVEDYWSKKSNCKTVDILENFEIALNPFREYDFFGFDY
jgi:alpha-1,3-fucosyltransferase